MKIFHKKIKGSKILNKAVLVLNANYSPMMICSAKHAIGMVYLEKVDVLVNYPQKVKSPNKFFDLPSIIKIRNYVRHDNLSVELNRKNILSRDKQICQYCGKSNLKLTIDHIIPRGRGGQDNRIWKYKCFGRIWRSLGDKISLNGLFFLKNLKHQFAHLSYGHEYDYR